jgi:phosphoribosylformylglycinamidine cyclo-ligase
LHSNGFSLARKVVETTGLTFQSPAPFDTETTLGEAMLIPTRIYVKSCLAAIRDGGVHALAHITGGGLIENIPRVLPSGLGVELDAAEWVVPNLFKWMAKVGGVASDEMNRTFNCGVGMVCVIAADRVDHLRNIFEKTGERVFTIGKVVNISGNTPTVQISNPETQWQS